MPTPFSEMMNVECRVTNGTPRRSVFGNYQAQPAGDQAALAGRGEGEAPVANLAALQSSIDSAVARAFLYCYLAKAFEDPEAQGWAWLSDSEVKSTLHSAAGTLSHRDAPSSFVQACENLASQLSPAACETFAASHIACFGHTVRGDCPMNEIEYGDIKADPLFQPHRLADLCAFYAAFGLELVPDAAERQDHISIELEFMAVLAAKEAYAFEHQFDFEAVTLLRDAQKKFLREHLARWTPAFTRRLARLSGDTALGALASFTREFIMLECASFGIAAGSEDLLLRPIDEADESLCGSCGIRNLPPGATRSPMEG